MITEDVAGWLSFVFALLLLGFFGAMIVIGKFMDVPGSQELSKIVETRNGGGVTSKVEINSYTQNDQMITQTKKTIIQQGDLSSDGQLDKFLQSTKSTLQAFFIDQVIKAVIISFSVWAIFVTWFSFEGTRFITFFGFLWGTLATCVIAFVIFHFSIPALGRFLVDASIGKGSAFATGWLNSTALSSCMISIVLFFYLIFVPISKFFFVDQYDGESEYLENLQEDTLQYFGSKKVVSHQIFYYGILSYGIAILTSGIFLRDIPKTIGLGFSLGHDLTCKLTSSGNINNSNARLVFQKGDVIGGVMQVMQLALDGLCYTTVTILVTTLLISHTDLIGKDETEGNIYLPVFFVSLLSFLVCAASLIAMGLKGQNHPSNQANLIDEPGQGIKSFIASHIRAQMIIVFALAFVVSIVVAYSFLPSTPFSLGTDDNKDSIFYQKEIKRGNLIWCLVIGIFTQIAQISIIEFFTSHKFTHFKTTSAQIQEDISLGFTGINKTAHVSHFLLLFILSLAFLWCTQSAGILGLAFCALGLASTSIILMSCSIFGSTAIQSNTIVKELYGFSTQLIRKIVEIQYSTKTYQSYQPIINSGGVFLINMVVVGLIDLLSTKQKMLVWEYSLFFGILLGMGVAYFLKGTGIYTLNSLLEELVQDEKNGQSSDTDFKSGDATPYLLSKVGHVFIGVLANFLISLLSIFMISWLFGGTGIIGYLIGLNFSALHITYFNSIKTQAAINLRSFNQRRQNQSGLLSDGQHSQYSSIDKASAQLEITERANESNNLILYLLFNALFVLQGIRVIQYWSKTSETLEKAGSELPNSVVEGTESAAKTVSDFLTPTSTKQTAETTKEADGETEEAETA